MAYVAPTNVATGDVLTAATWNQAVVENVAQLYASQKRIAYATQASPVNAGTNVGDVEVFTDVTFTAAGSTAYLIEVFTPYVETGTGAGQYVELHLTNGSTTSLGIIGLLGKGDGTRSAIGSILARYRYTPSAGSVTLNASFKNVSGSGGGGGALSGAVSVPAYLAVYGPDIT